MPACNRLKLAFCHIPRTGGVSVVHSLNMEVKEKHRPVSWMRERYPGYTLFTILRPWEDRIKSAHAWNPEPHLGVPLNAFVKARMLQNRDKGESDLNAQRRGVMTFPNEYFLDAPVDYTLRFEHLQEDLDAMLRELGHPLIKITHVNSFRDHRHHAAPATTAKQRAFQVLCAKVVGAAHKTAFKADPAYVDFLDVMPRQFDELYLRHIHAALQRQGVHPIPWDHLVRVDAIGRPATLKVGTHTVSPAALRHIFLATEILRRARDLGLTELDLIEVGGGSGEQAYALWCLAPLYGCAIRSYVLYDLPEACALQQECLSHLAPDLPVQWPPLERADELSQTYFLFSDGGFDRMDFTSQQVHCTLIGKAAPHGFLVGREPPGRLCHITCAPVEHPALEPMGTVDHLVIAW